MIINEEKELLVLNSSNILKFITQEDIYKQYCDKNFKFNVPFSSPFRDDKKPSFIIGGPQRFYKYKDFSTGESGNAFTFVMKLYNLDYNNALLQIVNDLNIKQYFIITDDFFVSEKIIAKYENPGKTINIGEIDLQIKIREFKQYDLDYWNSFGISLEYLKLGRIYAISHYFINNVPIHAEKLAYAYVEKKDNKVTYKIYQPLSKHKKWINNNNYSVWELWHLLPKIGDVLIITSSRKDALSIIENLKIPAISFQAESVMPKEIVMKDVLSRFKKVYLLYDNDYNNPDNPGQKLALKLKLKYPELINIFIDEKYLSKDYSDLNKNTNRVNAKNILNKIINNEV